MRKTIEMPTFELLAHFHGYLDNNGLRWARALALVIFFV